MRNINYVLILSASLVHTASFSYVNNKTSCHNEFYCPQQIACSQDGNVKSCVPIGSKLEYWNLDEMSENGRVVKGTYKFMYTVSTYQSTRPDLNQASCTYIFQNGNINKYISLASKNAAYVGAAVTSSASWVVNGYFANCNSNTLGSGSCPLIEPGLYIKKLVSNNIPLVKVKLSANGNPIILDNGPSNGASSLVTYDDAVPACGGVKQCRIDIDIDVSGSNNPIYPINVGSVDVDMTSDMKIININPNLCSSYTVKIVESFNTIMFVKSDQIACKSE